MVARKRLTDAAIQRLARPKTGERIEIWDRDPSGFGNVPLADILGKVKLP